MLNWWPRLHRTAIAPALIFLACLLTACTVGPLEISLRAGPDSATDPNIASTVTAVFATNTAIAMLRTATAEAPAGPLPAQATLPPPTAAPVAQDTSAPLHLIYSPDSFALINTSSRTENIAGLDFRSSSGELSIARWDNGYLTASLYAFPPGDCLMAWGLDTDPQPKPAECDVRHAWVAVNNQQTFWKAAEGFTVFWYSQVLAECPGSSGICTITPP